MHSGRYSFPMIILGRLFLCQDDTVCIALSHDMYTKKKYTDYKLVSFNKFKSELSEMKRISRKLKRDLQLKREKE